MSTPLNPKLYAQVKAEADAKFLAPTSIYKSAWIVREYKKRGGTYDPSKKDKKQGLLRWFDEKWVDTNRGNAPCGRKKASTKGTYPLCRPTVRVTKDTPTLKQEITRQALEQANKEKQKIIARFAAHHEKMKKVHFVAHHEKMKKVHFVAHHEKMKKRVSSRTTKTIVK